MSTHSTSTPSPRRAGRTVAIAALVTAAVVAVTGGVVLTVDANRAASASSSSSHGSDTVRTLQQELADLNFYNGPITGHMGTQTIDAIKDLQAAAHLPQTGVMNSQTRAALITFLAQGDNVMGSSS